jgi:predicted ester cyclase
MARSTTPEENKRLARRYPEDVATEGDIHLIDTICTEDVVEHSPLGERRGTEALKEQSEYIHAAFPDVSVTIEDVVAEGDTVAQRLTFRGTHQGEFMGIEPTDNELEIANTLFTRVEDGHIAERWLLIDTLGLLQQLGAVDPPGE